MRGHQKAKLLVGIVLLSHTFLLMQSTQSRIIRVPLEQQTIQSAIRVAGDGDTVLVDPGIYMENINFEGKNIIVTSQFIISSDTSFLSKTVINGSQSGHVVTFESGEDSSAALIGFTITNGKDVHGGGIYCESSSPTLTYLHIEGNSAEFGAGIYITSGSSPILTDLVVRDNTARSGSSSGGGGIYIWNSDPILNNVVIIGNSTKGFYVGSGGGIGLSFSSPKLTNVSIIGNSAGSGGGISCTSSSNPILINVRIIGNYSRGNGGGISCFDRSSPLLRNSLIVNNSAGFHGGGINSISDSNPVLLNVTVSNNSATDGGGGINVADKSEPVIVNSIFWNDDPEEIYFDSSGRPNSVTITHSDIQGGEVAIESNNNGTINWLDGNIEADPLFGDDFRLQSESPCIDAGTAFFYWKGDTLMDLSPDEYTGASPDMGAFEYNALSVDHDKTFAPLGFSLYQNYPNPANPSTRITFTLPERAQVTLEIYNLLGQRVRMLVDGVREAGSHSITWDGRDESGKVVSTGIYLYRLQSEDFVRVKKMVLVR